MHLKPWVERGEYPDRPTRAPDAGDGRSHGKRETEAMASERITEAGGMLLVSGALAFIIHIVLRSVLTAGVGPVASAQATLWVPVNILGSVGAMLVLLGFPAVYVQLDHRANTPGFIGLGLLAVSWMFFGVFLSLYGALIVPWLADQAPYLVDGSSPTPTGFTVAYGLGLLAWLVGSVLLAVTIRRGPAKERWVGYALPASAIWAVVGGFVIAPDGPASNLAVNLISNLGPVLLLVGLGYLGFRVWVERPGTRF